MKHIKKIDPEIYAAIKNESTPASINRKGLRPVR